MTPHQATLSDLIRTCDQNFANIDAALAEARKPLTTKPTINPETGEWEYRPAPASDMPWLSRRAILATNTETGK